jgi:hypothetical protein
MSKKVLAIYYTQSGQLEEIIDSFISPLIEENISVEKVRIHLANDFPFPWTSDSFFSVMPDCVLGVSAELAPFQLKEKNYDLIIFGYQAWFLSPGIPSNSLLQNEAFKNVLKNTPVVTITGARNMWLNAFARLRNLLSEAGAKLVGNIALTDKQPNLVSIFTVFHWMLHGKKDRYLKFFPRPGVSDKDIINAKNFGTILLPYLHNNQWGKLQDELISAKAVEINEDLMFIEPKAGKMFKLWANFISKRQNKKAWLRVFKYYLLIALFVAAPLVFIIDTLFLKPFFPKHLKSNKQYFLKLK